MPVDEGWLVERLRSEGLLAPERLAAARARQIAEGGALAAHLFAVGAVDESNLLRVVSIAHRTSYVTIDKLARARIAPEVLARIPSQVATLHHVLPLQYDGGARVLSVVASDPSEGALEAARDAAQAVSVRAFVALPQAVDAAIRRFYRGEEDAFAGLDGSAERRPRGKRVTGPPGLGPTITFRPAGAAPAPTGPSGAPATLPPDFDDLEFTRPEPTRRGLAVAPTGSATTQELFEGGDTKARGGDLPVVPVDAYLETLKVLVSLSEMGSASWRQGHAAEVARQARRLGHRLGLTERQMGELVTAAYLHDVGKPEEPHLTLLGLSMVPDQRSLAERVWSAPTRLFAGARLPESVLATLGALYERPDGLGLPRRRRGKDIPLYARILALVDAYVDLTVNPFGAAGGNVYDRDAALDTLRRHKDTLFDAQLVDILAQVLSGEDLRHRLLGDRARVLLADGDPEATAMIELKLVAEGYEVRSVRSSSEALRAMTQWMPDLVVTEVKLEPTDGFALVEETHRQKRTEAVPFLFLTERASAADIDRGFALGAIDYLTKPVPLDVLAVKVRRFVADRARQRDAAPGRRVVGSLAEMPCADVVEILTKGKKTGALRLAGRGDVFLDGGRVVHAACPPDKSGQEALFALLRVREGEFAFEAGVPAPTRSIDAATEWLLLEALRRVDEGQVA